MASYLVEALERLSAIQEVHHLTREGRPRAARRYCARASLPGIRVRSVRGEVVVEALVGAQIPHSYEHIADVIVRRKGPFQ